MDKCIWRYRPGTKEGVHYAFTPCNPGFNFLSKIIDEKQAIGVVDCYNGRKCPICGKPIEVDYSDIK